MMPARRVASVVVAPDREGFVKHAVIRTSIQGVLPDIHTRLGKAGITEVAGIDDEIGIQGYGLV